LPFYIEERKFIEPPHKIDFFALAEEDGHFWERVLNKFGTVYPCSAEPTR